MRHLFESLFLYISLKLRHLEIDNFEAFLTIVCLILFILYILYSFRKRSANKEDSLLKFYSIGHSFFPIILFVLILRSTVGELYNVGESDITAQVKPNSKILINKIKWGIRAPLSKRFITYGKPFRGEIVAVNYEFDPESEYESYSYISRVVGLAGETITLEKNQSSIVITTVEGEKIDHLLKPGMQTSPETIEFVIPPDSVFLIGDTFDLEYFTLPLVVPIDQIKGSLLYQF